MGLCEGGLRGTLFFAVLFAVSCDGGVGGTDEARFNRFVRSSVAPPLATPSVSPAEGLFLGGKEEADRLASMMDHANGGAAASLSLAAAAPPASAHAASASAW